MNHYPDVSGPDPDQHPALALLLAELRERHQQRINCVLLYGSCLRSGDIFDGLLDLYLICDDYRSSYPRRALALSNWLLPPNVFYAQVEHEDKVLRSKVTVISVADFRSGCSPAWFESYIWGRFAQPTRVIYARDEASRAAIEVCLLDAARTLLRRSLPALPAAGSLSMLWQQALGLSYATELRTERSGRAAELVGAAAGFYETISRQLADSLGFPFEVYDNNDSAHYRCHITPRSRRLALLGWHLRRVQGKGLSIARLIKALFTFEGGLDYIAWKLERHSGEKIVIPDKVRRLPLIYLWGFFWGLYRRGIFK